MHLVHWVEIENKDIDTLKNNSNNKDNKKNTNTECNDLLASIYIEFFRENIPERLQTNLT